MHARVTYTAGTVCCSRLIDAAPQKRTAARSAISILPGTSTPRLRFSPLTGHGFSLRLREKIMQFLQLLSDCLDAGNEKFVFTAVANAH